MVVVGTETIDIAYQSCDTWCMQVWALVLDFVLGFLVELTSMFNVHDCW